ncbi:hypothetical protein EfmU0317_1293 [Enterococcus faecium U0317]|nr:hypothetical protein EfmU0317_1293 [Enterococcus faecium U0317]
MYKEKLLSSFYTYMFSYIMYTFITFFSFILLKNAEISAFYLSPAFSIFSDF